MSYKEIMKLPYITFVIGMFDAPHVDYDKKEKVKQPQTKEEEIAALNSIFR